MNRDDIIRMARESADQSPREDWNTNAWVFGEEALERFAALVAAAERSACVDIVNDNTDMDGVCCTDDLLAAIRARGEK